MTGKSLWYHIKTLVECDQKIVAFSEEIARLKDALIKDRNRIEQSNGEREGQRTTTFVLQKNLQLKELSGKELKQQEERKRTQLEHVKDQKSYMALEREIETLSQKRAQLEEESLKELYRIDALKKDMSSLQQYNDQKQNVLLHDIALKTENLQNLEQKLAEQLTVRTSIIPNIQPEWYAQYERMKGRVPDPIVPVLSSSCSGCFYPLPHQELSRVKHGDIIVCRSCYRFVYYNADEESSAQHAQY